MSAEGTALPLVGVRRPIADLARVGRQGLRREYGEVVGPLLLVHLARAAAAHGGHPPLGVGRALGAQRQPAARRHERKGAAVGEGARVLERVGVGVGVVIVVVG